MRILLYVLLYVVLRVFCYMFCCMFCCVFFVICFVICFVVLIFSQRAGLLLPERWQKKRAKMNSWVEKKRSKTGKSGLKKMAKNGQKLPKKHQKLKKHRCDARARRPRCLEGFNLKKKMKKRKDKKFGLVRGFKQK